MADANSILSLKQGSAEWEKLRKRGRENLYWFNHTVLGFGSILPMSLRAHYGMCRFAERRTGIPIIDNSRVQLIQVHRGFGKSALVTQGRSIQRFTINRDWAIGIGNERQLNANAFLGSIKAIFEQNEFLKFLYPEIIPNFRKTTWKEDRIVIQRTPGKPNPVNPSVLAAGVGATVTGVHMNEWIIDDLISKDAAENARSGSFSEIEKANRFIVQLPPLLTHPTRDPLTFIGCIAEDQPVLMADGTWKAIKDVEIGDEVWAAKKDGSEGFAARKVTGVWPQGKSDVIEVSVAGRQLHCTKDHPLLAADGGSTGRNRRWEKAGELTHKVMVFEGMGEEEDEEVDLDWMWLLGFLWGDGWIINNRNRQVGVAFALGEDEKINARAAELLESRYGYELKVTPKREMRLDCIKAGIELYDLGMVGGAGGKRIPNWLWCSSTDAKRAWLKGFCDADGCQTSATRWAVEIANEGLISDIHKLAMTCHVRPSSITSRTRTIQPPNSPEPVTNTFYHVALNFLDRRTALHKYKPTTRELDEQVEVYDLTVEDGDCGFIAGGLCVGNTPWWLGDCYDFIEETFGGEGRGNVINWRLKLPDGSHQTIKLIQKGDLAIFRMPAIDEEGRAINEPMGFTLEELEKTRRIDPVFFAAQYLLNPSGGDAADFRLDWLKPFQWDNPNTTRFTDIDGRTRSYNIHETSNIISVDPAISSKEGSADSAIAVTGTDGRHILLYEGWVDRVSPTDLAHQILTFYQRYRASSIVIESVGYQEALGDVLEMLAKNEYGIRERLPIHEHVTGSTHKKEVRIRGLEPYFRRGLFYYHHTSEAFIRQYQGFPHIKLRDLLDALSFQREQWERLALHGETDDFRGGMVGKRSAAIKRQVNRIKDRYARRRRGGDRHYG